MSDVLLAGRYCNGAPTGQHIVLFRLVLFFHSCAKSEALSKSHLGTSHDVDFQFGSVIIHKCAETFRYNMNNMTEAP